MFIHRRRAPRRERLILTYIFVFSCRAVSAFGQPPADPTPPASSPVPDKPWYQDLSFNGLLSTSLVVNLNTPTSRTNQFRVFDADDRSFTLDVLELVVQRATSSPGQFGFRADFEVGSSVPKLTAAAGLFRDDQGQAGDFDIQQALVSYIAPLGRGLRFDGGKFVTHMGYEVVEGYDGFNDNHSRSFLFGYAEPVTHTGLRLSYAFSDTVSGQFHLVNGWDNAKDNNRGKSFGGQLAITPTPRIAVTVNYMGGPEQADNSNNLRHLFDLIATVKAAAAVTLAANYDYGREAQVALADTAGGGVRDVTWQGIAGYVRTALSPRMALIIRGECFDDPQGARTAVAQRLTEFTMTAELRVNPKFILRGDLRGDRSNHTVFEKSDGTFTASQVTVSLNGVVGF
ncbi:MAG: outer membrane beta-barrel protein [Aeromicrobium sp.]